MANPIVEGSKLINGLSIYEVAGTPNQGPGVGAIVGSVALSNDAGLATFWQKTGTLDTQWTQIGGGGGGITGGVNLGLGFPIFAGVAGTNLEFATLNAGLNIAITPQLDGSLTITGTGGGGPPNGDPNTVAYFDPTFPHPLTDNLNFTFFPAVPLTTPARLGVGVANPTGNIQIYPVNPAGYASPDYCVAILGQCDPTQTMGSGVLLFGGMNGPNWSLGVDSIVGGRNSRVTAGEDSVAIGNGVTVSGDNSVAFGLNTVASGSHSFVCGDSSQAIGVRSFAANSFTTAAGESSAAFGSLTSALGNYSFAGGSTQGGLPSVLSLGDSSFVFGKSENGSFLVAGGSGAVALGYSGAPGLASSSINSAGAASFAFGRAIDGGNIASTGDGSLAGGYVINAMSNITVGGLGSFAWGVSDNGMGTFVTVNATASQAFGTGHQVISDYSTAFGYGHSISSKYCFAVGKYASAIGGDSSVDPAFVVGNGTSSMTANNAFEVDRDGKLITTGAQKHKAIKQISDVDTPYSLSPRTDRTVLVDSTVAPITINMPAGEDGLEYFIKDIGNASVNNITFVPDGVNVMEATSDITNTGSSRHFQFYGNTWYIISMP